MNEPQERAKPSKAFIAAGAIVAALAIGGLGFWAGANRSAQTASSVQAGRTVLYWYDPMRPDVHFSAPGKSPYMDMPLQPRYADEAPADASVRIDPSVAQNFGVRYAAVESAPIAQSVTAAGVSAFNERQVAQVQARAQGFVERSYGRAIGDIVAADAPIVDIRVPDWTAAQAEYLALRSGGGELADAARRRLFMLGMPASLIARVEREGAPRPVATIVAPISGAITALDIRNGMIVTPGAPLATINGVSPVWLVASLPQADASVAQRGGRVVARVPAYPGETFSGRIETVLPSANPETRTVEVRITLANPNLRLRPGMTGEAELSQTSARPGLLVPAEAVIQTGRRTLVIVAADGGRFLPTEVEIGHRSGDRIEITSGLSEGQRVVASGQFLIDSEASLTGALERLEASAQSQTPAPTQTVAQGRGRIAAIDAQSVTIAHGPIEALHWPAMSMQFRFASPSQAQGLRVGDEVEFRFHQASGGYSLDAIAKSGANP